MTPPRRIPFSPPKLRPGLGALVAAASLFSLSAEAAALKVMTMGLGTGTVTGTSGINCSESGAGTCDMVYASSMTVTLTATATGGSTFGGWETDPDADTSSAADCAGLSTTCVVTMGVARSVRPVFNLPAGTVNALTAVDPNAITPEEIENYLNNPSNAGTNTVARFLAALPAQYRQSPILMARSESLQTGTAEHPRLLLASNNARSVFSIGPVPHASYPGSHPDVIEYMQWDEATKNFRFHEIILGPIPAMGSIPPRTRHIEKDDTKCSACHSTRNVVNRTTTPGTDGSPPGIIQTKNKPNWDPYDSWGGMLPFNRDRLYQGSVDTAAFRKLYNPWTWRANLEVRRLVGQLRFQPAGVGAGDVITRWRGGAGDGTPRFPFDTSPPVTTEPVPTGPAAPISTAYTFNNATSGAPTSVVRGGSFVTLYHAGSSTTNGEGRGVQLFDLLGGLDGDLNQRRIADEVARHRWATGSVFIDPRPVALAINKGCLTINTGMNMVTPTTGTLTVDQSFFVSRAGMTLNDLRNDTQSRSQSIPRRKADIEKLTLDRAADLYVLGGAVPGLIPQHGAATSAGVDTSLPRIRREVFRRPFESGLGGPDSTVMGGIYVDRELYSANTSAMTLYRFFLEPLGVSVDKWSLGVRGRSRAYGFADVFDTYRVALRNALEANLTADPVPGLASPYACASLIPAVNATLATLPLAAAVPTYTDVQRIFNKGCIECHGGLDYPPYAAFSTFVKLAEDQSSPSANPLAASYGIAAPLAGTNPASSFLYDLITRTSEDCTTGMMPCGGPALSKTDVETIRRWIVGANPSTWGDPHLTTMDGVPYDFQGAGEYVLLRDPGMEVQARHTPIQTEGPVGPNDHTGLTSCVSLTTAMAARVGKHRVSYQMAAERPESLELRVDGKLVQLGTELLLPGGGRITRTTANGGLQIEGPGGTRILVTLDWWAYYGVWYMNVGVQQSRATEGLLGVVGPGNWLPALPDGTQMGPRPASLAQRHSDLYARFGEAWRVTPGSSLFDYASGYSTDTYTLREWPEDKATQCLVAKPTPGIPVKAPLKSISLDEALQLCKPVRTDAHRRMCMEDVAATGERSLVNGFVTAEQVEGNLFPDVPVLLTPKEYEATASTVTFNWKGATDKDGDSVLYRHCVWSVDMGFTHARACAKPTRELSRTVTLEKGREYLWKVLAEDGKGGVTESLTWRLTAK